MVFTIEELQEWSYSDIFNFIWVEFVFIKKQYIINPQSWKLERKIWVTQTKHWPWFMSKDGVLLLTGFNVTQIYPIILTLHERWFSLNKTRFLLVSTDIYILCPPFPTEKTCSSTPASSTYLSYLFLTSCSKMCSTRALREGGNQNPAYEDNDG